MTELAAAYPYCVAAGHVEGKAALQLRACGSSGGTVHHNHPSGTCLYCSHALPALLAPGVTLSVVPPTDARAPDPWWIARPVTFVGRAADSPVTAAPAGMPDPGGIAVYSLGAAARVTSPAELDAQLQLRAGAPNHFALSPAPVGHPLLTLMVDGPSWVAHHFASPNDPGSIAIGGGTDARAVVAVPDPSGAAVTLAGGAALDGATARHLAMQLFDSWARPGGVAWRSAVAPAPDVR